MLRFKAEEKLKSEEDLKARMLRYWNRFQLELLCYFLILVAGLNYFIGR
jgi:hypothetical protein